MDYLWTDWKRSETGLDPYVDWSLNGPGETPIIREKDKRRGDSFLRLMSSRVSEPRSPFVFAGLREPIPVPEAALNLSGPGGAPRPIDVVPPDVADLPSGSGADETPIAKDTIIAGVIDVGMPIGHRRWLFADGRTRILAAWQMIGDWSLKKQPKIPFGCEFYEREINALLATHSGGTLQGRLDEMALNEAVGAVTLRREIRQTDLLGRASHGAHVLDIVAGVDPVAEPDFARRVRIIAVNAPSSGTFGASGAYLDNFMLHAIQRIVDLADGIWQKQMDAGHSVPDGGYPIVINLSFGKQAGAKDEMDRFAAELARFACDRRDRCRSQVEFIMPAGNDNQDRCNAFLAPGVGHETETLPWRMLPEDQSSNFAEVWTNGPQPAAGGVRLDFSPPAGAPPLPPLPTVTAGQTFYSDLEQDGTVIARVSATWVEQERFVCPKKGSTTVSAGTYTKMRYAICVLPTYRPTGKGAIAPSGLWTIRLASTLDPAQLCFASVQTDQRLSPNRATNLRSYFDDPRYVRHDDMGRLRDSYSYTPFSGCNVVNQDNTNPDGLVRRHGTINASSAHKAVARVGGYRASDGRPAFYSATGRGRKDGTDRGKPGVAAQGNQVSRAPTASFPTEDGPALFGILAAGAADGSVAAMRGTSFASSQGSRFVIDALLTMTFKFSAKGTLVRAARVAEGKRTFPCDPLPEAIEVLGAGRIPAPVHRNPPRR